MPNVLEETTSQEIDSAHIERRVGDWIQRIDTLYSAITEWLSEDWSADRRGTISMNEELMQKYKVAARDLPVLKLLHHGRPSAKVEPRGLWIIGANGRLDMTTGSKHYVIVDFAENFDPPKWHIAPLSDRRKSTPLNREALSKALA